MRLITLKFNPLTHEVYMKVKFFKLLSTGTLVVTSGSVFAAGACCVAGGVCCALGLPCCI
jgi:hypothetical protein